MTHWVFALELVDLGIGLVHLCPSLTQLIGKLLLINLELLLEGLVGWFLKGEGWTTEKRKKRKGKRRWNNNYGWEGREIGSGMCDQLSLAHKRVVVSRYLVGLPVPPLERGIQVVYSLLKPGFLSFEFSNLLCLTGKSRSMHSLPTTKLLVSQRRLGFYTHCTSYTEHMQLVSQLSVVKKNE